MSTVITISSAVGRRLAALVTLLTLALCAQAADADYKIIPLTTDTLPSLTMPRTGHVTLCLDGELTVLGGHTDGFIPEASAEYFRDGAWHRVPLVYAHDHGIALALRSGKVFLAGGHKEPLGIGQLFSAELYDPKTHTSQGFGCLDKKRAYGNAIEMTDGKVFISGNWFADDGIGVFTDISDGMKPNAIEVKEASVARATPYILRVSPDDAIIFSSLDNKADAADPAIIDRLKGSSYREPFLETWCPIRTINIRRSYNHFIGNEAEGRYEWLLPVENDATRRVAIARVTGPESEGGNPTFSLLPTAQPVPDSIGGKAITYSSLICDRERSIAYLIGDNDEARVIVVAIPYDTPEAAPLTIYVTEPQPFIAQGNSPVLTAEGDLVFAGGHLINNFTPSSAVVKLPLGSAGSQQVAAAQADSASGNRWWLWILIPCLIAAIVAAIALPRRRKPASPSAPTPLPVEAEPYDDAALDKNLPKDTILADLFKRIDVLMEEERLYLNPNLRAADVADRVSSNTAYVSAAINSQRGCSFSQFLTTYRITYAQRLMRSNPESKLSAISTLSGFSTDSTFFRAFRSVTGMSPKEWLAANHKEK